MGVGAALGAWLRWGLSTWLNPRIAHFPLGTLTANLAGGYLIGLAVAYFLTRHDLPPQWRLFVVTGFLGGLTTFSSYGLQTFTLLREGETFMASVNLIISNVVGLFLVWTGYTLSKSL